MSNIPYFSGKKIPDRNDVYELKDGRFARYENGLWYMACTTIGQATKTQEKAGFMSPQFRIYENLKWREI